MHKTLHYIALLFLLFTVSKGFCSIEYNNNIEKAHRYILNFDYTEANQLLKAEKLSNPSNLYVEYLEAYQFFLKAYFEAKTSDYENFIESSELCIKLLDNENDQSTAAVLASTLSIQRAFIFFLWGHHYQYVRALMNGQSFNEKIDVTNPELLKIKSLYEVIGGSVPSKYQGIAKLFNIEGEQVEGLRMIEDYLKNSDEKSINRVEGQIIQLYLSNFLDLEDKPKVSSKNALLNYLYLKTGQLKATKRIELVDSLLKEHNSLPSYFTFIKAQSLLELQDKKGIETMDLFLKQHQGISFIHTARFYKWWYYISQEDLINSKLEKESIQKLPEPLFSVDKKSLNRVQKTNWNSTLVKARMLFDAGEYQQSLDFIKQKNILGKLKSIDNKIELLYRLGRAYEMTGEIEEALKAYQNVINTQQSHLYFVAFSAYRSGKIYLKLNDKASAKSSFLHALELNEGEYKISIEKKCQFALVMCE